jgi:hypothetical protein
MHLSNVGKHGKTIQNLSLHSTQYTHTLSKVERADVVRHRARLSMLSFFGRERLAEKLRKYNVQSTIVFTIHRAHNTHNPHLCIFEK